MEAEQVEGQLLNDERPPRVPFKKLKTEIENQLSILKEDEVVFISFDWHAAENYLKCSYNLKDPLP